MNAEQWARSLDANAFTTQDQWLPPHMAKEIAECLRAGIAASEECERLRALLERAAGLLLEARPHYPLSPPEFNHSAWRDGRDSVLAEIEGALK